MSRVAVVVVTFNGARWIRGCLASLRDCAEPPHTIVVDNCSSDDTPDIVAQEFPQVELVRRTSNGGFGVGNNVGIARAIARGADYTFLLNQDAYVLPDTIGALTAFLDGYPEFGIATPMHCSPDQHSVDRKTYLGYLQTHASDFLCDAALDRRAPHYRIRGINAAAWFIRTSVFARVGGFDPLFFMYGEDDDLIARFARHGIVFGFLPGTRIVHLRETAGAAVKPLFWRDVERRAAKTWPGLVVRIKDPSYGAVHMALQVIAHGLVQPFAEYIVERDFRHLLACWLASTRVLAKIPLIRQRARLCATPGAHFLAGE